ncbi:MAG: ribonuclease HIII, partial [Candidatus Cloacimonetes bacterium]|nr:ribonuclease HIII [Candidatus Cloacimonadota bacterium]
HQIKAEEDLAVASASIIARFHFLNGIRDLSEKFGIEFPKGASEKVLETSGEFVKKYSKEKLNEVAKIHFKTYEKI